MDIKTFLECAKALPSNISILVKGKHGIGKSEVIHQLADQLGLELIDRRMSQMTEGDLVGLPKLEDGVTRFIPAEFVKAACDRPVFLFLDEVNRATQEVQQGVFQLVLDRQLNGNRLHPDTRVAAAVNVGGNYQVTEMDPAFIDRFFVADLDPTVEDFFAHAETRPEKLGGPVHRDMISFLKERPSRLDPSEANPGSKQPSRRSWVRLDRVFRANGVYGQSLDEDVSAKGRAYSLAVGLVGLEAANDCVDYLAKREARFNASHVLDAYPKHQEKIRKLGQDKLNALVDLVVEDAKSQLWTPEQAANLGMFVKDVPAELRVGFVTSYTKSLRGHANFQPNFKTMAPPVMPLIVASFNADGKIIGSKEAQEAEEAKKAEDEKASGKGKKSKK